MLDFNKIKNRLSDLTGKYYSDPMLAKDLDVSLKTIHNWKKENFSPRLSDMEMIRKLCKFNSLDEIVEK